MSELLQIIIHTVQGIALWAVWSRRKRILESPEHYFIYLITFIVLNDLLAKTLLYFFRFPSYIFYNSYDIIVYSFTLYYFYKILTQKTTVSFLAGCYAVILVISLIRESFFLSFLNLNVYGGSVITLILATIYYASLIQRPEPVDFLKLPSFWITTGFLIFNMGYLPIQFLTNFKDSLDTLNVYLVLTILNVLFYGSLTIAFLCFKKN